MFKVLQEGAGERVIKPLWASLLFIKLVKLHGSPQDSATLPCEEKVIF